MVFNKGSLFLGAVFDGAVFFTVLGFFIGFL